MLFLMERMGRIVDHFFTMFEQWVIMVFNVKQRLFFADGFGNLSSLVEADAFVHSVADGTIELPLPLVKTDNEYDDKYKSYDCSFPSPASFFLPENVRTALFRFIEPNGAMKGIIIILPHTGDEWYDHRTKMTRDLVEDGYAVIIPMVPFYGTRRGPKQNLHFVRSVELFVKAGLASALETAAIVKWVHKTYPSIKVCLAGVSNGGSVSAYTAFMIHESVTIVSVVGTDSASSIISGPLAAQIDWTALVRDRELGQGERELGRWVRGDRSRGDCSRWDRESVRRELSSIFSARSVSSMVPHRMSAPLHTAVCVTAKDDAFINKNDSELLHNALRRISHTKVVCVAGGHITSSLFNPARIVVPSIKSAMSF
jgi:hypothetical protein